MNKRTRSFLLSLVLLMLITSFSYVPVGPGVQPLDLLLGSRLIMADIAPGSYQEGVVIVEVTPTRDIQTVAVRYGLVVVEEIDQRTWLLRIPDGRTVPQVIGQMKRDPEVLSVEPNYLFQIPEINQRSIAHVNGPGALASFFDQSALAMIRVPEAQTVASGSGTVVAVIDTGIEAGHPVLGNISGGYDFVDSDSDPSETGSGVGYGHGTMVAGLINLVAPGASIMPIRAFGPDGRGTTVNIAKAIRYAAQRGANVINLSFGTTMQPQAIRGAVNFAIRQAILVTSAGNDSTDAPIPYPALVPEAVTVAATDLRDYKAALSNYGSSVDVCAPGVGLISAYPGGGFAIGNGTSFSAALVSGTVALAISNGSRDAIGAVRNSAVNIDALNPGYRGLLGSGRIDVYAALMVAR